MIEAPILIVDDEAEVREILQETLQARGFVVETAASGEEAAAKITSHHYPVVLSDVHMPGGMTGLELLRVIRERRPDTVCILITAYATLDTSLEAMKLGAYDLLQKPFSTSEMEIVLNRALDHAALLEKLRDYQNELESRILRRTQDLRDVQAEALSLCDLNLQALDAPSEVSAIMPFLDRLVARWAPSGVACFRIDGGGDLQRVVAVGPRPLPNRIDRLPTGVIPAPQLGYPEEHMLPLGNAGWLYLGFEERSAFSGADPAFCLLARHMELALRIAAAGA